MVENAGAPKHLPVAVVRANLQMNLDKHGTGKFILSTDRFILIRPTGNTCLNVNKCV